MVSRSKTSVAARLLTPVLAGACLAGCGQKGPLTLPSSASSSPATAASAPASSK